MCACVCVCVHHHNNLYFVALFLNCTLNSPVFLLCEKGGGDKGVVSREHVARGSGSKAAETMSRWYLTDPCFLQIL